VFKPAIVLACSLAMVFCVGCTSVQLRKHTNQQLRTTSEITQQQIMDNVAKIACNENAWPEFSNFADGTTQITDTGDTSLNLTWNARTIIQEFLGLHATRQLVEKWGTAATTDPSRLRAMWAVYHYTIYGSVPDREDYKASVQLAKVFGTKDWQKLIPPPGWFATHCEHEYCEKVHCGCLVGHYCDSQACVLPGHEEALQRRTFLIMYISSVDFGDDPFPTGVPGMFKKKKTYSAPKEGAESDEDFPSPSPAKSFNLPTPGPALTP
jgi:hypothetical protein